MNEKYLTVTALTKYLKYKFDTDDNLRKVYIKGEISNFKAHTTGHLYFSIKDESSIIKAIMFASNAKNLQFEPKEGSKVFVTGSVSVYPATGNYQIYVESLEEDGIGNLYIEFEKLKTKLSSEGLFDERYKKEIPKYPTKIGIVTASTGAAIRDILSTIKRRYPICKTYLFPCLVQGEYAAEDIVEKIKEANQYPLDVLIVGRGGGSFEDLNCFNDERVARTIFESKIPIISAVGHEVDFTIADFVSDLRAPTPTGAAEMAVPNIVDVKNMIAQYNIRLKEAIYKKVKLKKLYLDSIKNSFVIKNPKLMYQNTIQKLDNIVEKINASMLKKINLKKLYLDNIKNLYVIKNPSSIYEEKKEDFYVLYNDLYKAMNKKILENKNRLEIFKKNYVLKNPDVLYKDKRELLNNVISKLTLLNPLNILERGYSITYKDDHVISSIENVKIKDELNIRMKDGSVLVHVDKVVK